jgi:hypothetical protein
MEMPHGQEKRYKAACLTLTLQYQREWQFLQFAKSLKSWQTKAVILPSFPIRADNLELNVSAKEHRPKDHEILHFVLVVQI